MYCLEYFYKQWRYSGSHGSFYGSKFNSLAHDELAQIAHISSNVVWQWDNTDSFGNNVANGNPAGAGAFNFNLRFPGQYADQETNTLSLLRSDA